MSIQNAQFPRTGGRHLQEKLQFNVNCCSFCKQRETNERPVLHGAICGHRICMVCLKKEKLLSDRGNELVNLGIVGTAEIRSEVVGDSSITCPLCQKAYPRTSWVNLVHEQQAFNRAQRYRQQVLAVMNSSRDRFENTPSYDDYIELRELRINTIVEASEEKRRKLLEELRTEESQSQTKILEDKGKAEELKKEDIKEIVKNEGVFFQICSSQFELGFNTDVDRDMMHPLVNKHPEYFEDFLFTGSSASRGGPANFAVPTPLDSNITTYPQTVPKQSIDKSKYNDFLRACGFRKEIMQRKMRQEVKASLNFVRFRKIMKEQEGA